MSTALLTLVHADCARCGSTRDTVIRDRALLRHADAVCCEPIEPAAVPCFYCGTLAIPQVRIGTRAFCSRACWGDYAE